MAAQRGEAIWFQRKDDAENVRNLWQEGAPGHGYKFDQKYKEKLAVSLGELTPKVRRARNQERLYTHRDKTLCLPAPSCEGYERGIVLPAGCTVMNIYTCLCIL